MYWTFKAWGELFSSWGRRGWRTGFQTPEPYFQQPTEALKSHRRSTERTLAYQTSR